MQALKPIIVLLVFVAVNNVDSAAKKSFENIDVDAYDDDDRLNELVLCLKQEDDCSEDDKHLRDRLSDVLEAKFDNFTLKEHYILLKLGYLLATRHIFDLPEILLLYVRPWNLWDLPEIPSLAEFPSSSHPLLGNIVDTVKQSAFKTKPNSSKKNSEDGGDEDEENIQL